MFKKYVFIVALFFSACATSSNISFSSKDVVITRISDKAFNPREDSQKAAEIACMAFTNSCDGKSPVGFIRKSVLKKGENSVGANYFYARHYFDSAAFLKSLKNTDEVLKGMAKVYLSFYSSQERAYEYIKSNVLEKCNGAFCIVFSSEPFALENKDGFDYVAQASVYSYSIENPVNSSITVISSATVRVYSSIEKKQIGSFEVQETATSFDKKEASYKSLSACGENIENKLLNTLSQYCASVKRIKLIFSGVKDLNTLSEVRTILSSAGFGRPLPLSFVNGEVVFEVYAGSLMPEQLAGEIVRRGDLRYNIEYIDNGEIKFSVGENVVNH